MTRVLVLSAYYLPGFRAGGPLRTLANMVRALADDFDFQIVTRDRDLGDHRPYQLLPAGTWTEYDGVAVLYCPPSIVSVLGLARVLRDRTHDVLYLNSLFDAYFSILPILLRRLNRIPHCRLVLAPRGECAPAALRISSFRKRTFLAVARALGLHRDVLWHASSEFEAADIRRVAGDHAKIVVAPDLPTDPRVQSPDQDRAVKRAGELNVLFLSRISPMKNLEFALQVMRDVHGAVRLVIAGPIEDRAYWNRCQALIASSPHNVTVEYVGPVEHRQIGGFLRATHLLFLPTRGENFGHVIFEALSAGCPVLTSDRTPWREMRAQGAGWDLSLERPAPFVAAIEEMLACSAEEFALMSTRARQYALRWYGSADLVARSRAVFSAMHGTEKADPPLRARVAGQ